jgi:hypothetical protein
MLFLLPRQAGELLLQRVVRVQERLLAVQDRWVIAPRVITTVALPGSEAQPDGSLQRRMGVGLEVRVDQVGEFAGAPVDLDDVRPFYLMPVPSDDEIARDANFKSPEEAKKQGREVRFRLNVVAAYNYACALTGYRLTTISAGSIVDAVHIHQFSDSRNNDPRNGLALCKNAHWLFDNGLWTLADDNTVIVAVGRFAEDSPDQKPLAAYHGQKVHLPGDPALVPNPIHLAWHRKHKFQGV